MDIKSDTLNIDETKIKDDATEHTNWMLVFISITQFALFAENGRRLAHANFLWARIPSFYILFLVLIVKLASIKVGDNRIHKIKYNTCCFLLALHLISGVVFYVRSNFYGWEA